MTIYSPVREGPAHYFGEDDKQCARCGGNYVGSDDPPLCGVCAWRDIQGAHEAVERYHARQARIIRRQQCATRS